MALTESGLSCSPSYLEACSELRDAVCNGCGSANAKFDLVPNTVYGVSIAEACNIHDWDYYIGKTNEDKELADRRMRNNGVRIVDGQSANTLSRWLRRKRVLSYYLAVKHFGGPAFWKGKE